jgi:hypothetical protein
VSWPSSSLFVAALALGVACSDPSYSVSEREGGSPPLKEARDGGTTQTGDAVAQVTVDAASQNAGEDATTPTTTTATAAFRVGKYAVLARFYGTSGTSNTGWFAEEMTVLAEVQRVGDGLQMIWKTCAYDGRVNVPLFPWIDYAATNAEAAFPVRTLQLVLNGNTFQTLGGTSLIGYQEITQADCPVGSTQSHPERPWLPGGACTCPDSSTLLPTSPYDCRVTDTDGDDQPGITVQWTGGTENYSRSRIKDTSQLQNGTIDRDGRHSAQLAANYDNYQLACDRPPCSRYGAVVCPIADNPVRFEPLADSVASCAEVLDVVARTNYLGLGRIDKQGCQ